MSAFRVVSQCVLELDNAFIADAAKAWPRLENLTLLPSPLPEASTRLKMTLSGLIPLIRHCPDLNFLQVSIVADPFEPSLLLPKMFNMNITSLHFTHAHIDKPLAVFRCLVCMFPKLQEVTVLGSSGDWETLSSLIRESSNDIWPILRSEL
ncbi:hypothetical protein C0989_002830 [Termitomyces sp. Mn162]|nr:hypothetical protein C0989_002830 [Termitomyces sp. Mn162]